MTAKKPKLLELPPQDIRPNIENPRTHFPEITMDALAESIDEVGVQVPIAVYEDPDGGAPPYVLVDGERRWRCSLKLALPTIPAIVGPAPDPIENLRRMFHIHMKREAWDDIPTMRALVKLKERKGEEDITNLANETGLSKGRVQQLLFAATLPKEYQDLIEQKIIPLNFFYELKLQIDLLSKKRPAVFSKFGTEAILRAFVDKRLAGITKDVVDLRLMRPIINIAMEEANGPEGTSDLDAVIESLIKDREQTIQEAYENTVEMVVEADKFARQCQQLVARYDRLIAKAQTDEDIEMIEQAIKALQKELKKRISHLDRSH